MDSIPSARITKFRLASTEDDLSERVTPHSSTATTPSQHQNQQPLTTSNSSSSVSPSDLVHPSPYRDTTTQSATRNSPSTSSSSSSLTYLSRLSTTSLQTGTNPFQLDHSTTTNSIETSQPQLAPLNIATSSPDATHSPLNLSADSPARAPSSAPDRLPTYTDLESVDAASAAPRFGRWRGWIEKRAQERAEMVNEELDRLESKGWGDGADPLQRGISERPVQAERKMLQAGAVKAGIVPLIREDDSASALAGTSSPDVAFSRGPPPALLPRPGSATDRPLTPTPISAHPLTAALTLEPVGSRFSSHVLEEPLCSITLPAGTRGAFTERFVLVGTAQGLYVTDLHPSLSSGHLSLNPAEPLGKAVVLELWEGLGVHQLALHLELAGKTSSSPRGVVFGLVRSVGEETGGEVRMWSLATLTHLAQWRCHNLEGPPLDLTPSPTARASGLTSHDSKRNSTGGFLKGLVASGSTKTLSRLPSRRTGPDVSPKGKSRATEPSPSGSIRLSSAAQHEHLLADHPGSSPVGASSVAKHALREGSATSSHSRSSSNESIRSAASAGAARSSTSLPVEWAMASVALSLPKGHSPMTFFRICPAPPVADVPVLADYEDEVHRPSVGDFLYATVVTAGKLVYVYESAPSEQRRWRLLKELYAPSTPRFVKLVRSPAPVGSVPMSKRHSSALSAGPDLQTAATDLCLVLGLSAGRGVLIRISDLSVVELHLDWTGDGPTERRGSLPQAGRAPAAPAGGSGGAGLGRRAMNKLHKVASVASSVFDGSGGLPAGMRDDEARGLSKGVRLGQGEVAGSEHGSTVDLLAPSKANWAGCDELRLPALTKVDFSGVSTLERPARSLYLITKGAATHLALSPFGFAPARLLNSSRPGTPPSQASSPGGMSGTPGALSIKPVQTFVWPRPVRRVVAMLKPPAELVPELVDSHRLLVLLGVHEHGVFVQEGLLNLAAVDRLFAPARAASSPAATSEGSPVANRAAGGRAKAGEGPVFVRTRGVRVTPLRREREAGAVDGERDDSIEVDFGRRAAVLSGGVKEAGERVYLAVEGRADWQLQALE